MPLKPVLVVVLLSRLCSTCELSAFERGIESTVHVLDQMSSKEEKRTIIKVMHKVNLIFHLEVRF